MRIAVPRESAAGENRVALVPDSVAKLVKAGFEVAIEHEAGAGATFSDQLYVQAGGLVAPDFATTCREAEVVLKVQRPNPGEVELLPSASILIALLQPAMSGSLFEALAARGVTSLAMEFVPRITRAQSMDALSSQANIAGYKSVLVGAAAMTRLLPMLTTAAGTIAPAKVFILGAGVAGLQAIATARRLGAVVSAFDVRPAVREQVQSLGASFIAADMASAGAETAGGYAQELAHDQHERELEAIHRHIRDMDLVITTAQIPGRPAPRLITEAMIGDMKPGAVIVDLAADSGGNCELTQAGETRVVNGVSIIGAVNLPATVPFHASQMYSRNLETLVKHLVADEKITINLEDEITGAMVVTHGGSVRARP
ncbi:MAG: Re/Si-specific NAD(P)(+) transhydrogenase subunit alpha [Gemmatimonadota bacterium]